MTEKIYFGWTIGRVKYGIELLPCRFWWSIWKPKWHDGHGYYVTIGVWLFAFYRGY